MWYCHHLLLLPPLLLLLLLLLGDTLVDLGSGTGRVVLGAALSFPDLAQASCMPPLKHTHVAVEARLGSPDLRHGRTCLL